MTLGARSGAAHLHLRLDVIIDSGSPSDTLATSAHSEPSPAAPFPWLGMIAIAITAFFGITSELLPTGLLPEISAGVGVSQPIAGLLVTVFAFSVVLTATPLVALTRRWPRRRLIVAIVGLVILGNIGTALAPDYAVAVIARVVGGAGHGVFFAVVASYAAHLVDKRNIGRAVSITFGGGSLGLVAGVPLGTALGHLIGWRFSFAALAVALAACVVLLWRVLPVVPPRPEFEHAAAAAGTRERDHTVLPVLVMSAAVMVVMTGHYAFFTYIAPFITGPLGMSSSAVGLLLLLYGASGALGLLATATFLGRRPRVGLMASLVLILVSVVVLSVFVHMPVVAVIALIVWGVAFGTLAPLFQTQVLHTASVRFRDTATAVSGSAWNVGIGIGALVGAVIYQTSGLGALPWFYVVVVGGLTVAIVGVQVVLAARTRRVGAV